MTLKPFNPKSICPKCEHDQVRTWYCDNKDTLMEKCNRKVDSEHLHRFCDRCHFEWLESCVDKVVIDA